MVRIMMVVLILIVLAIMAVRAGKMAGDRAERHIHELSRLTNEAINEWVTNKTDTIVPADHVHEFCEVTTFDDMVRVFQCWCGEEKREAFPVKIDDYKYDSEEDDIFD